MKAEEYQKLVSAQSSSVSKLLGEAIKDKQVSPEEYGELCKSAKAAGFKFVDIIFA